MSSSVLRWRAPLWIAASTIISFLTGCGSFVYLVVSGNGNLVLVIGCWAFAGLIPPLVALERLVALRTGTRDDQEESSRQSSGSSASSSSALQRASSDGGEK